MDKDQVDISPRFVGDWICPGRGDRMKFRVGLKRNELIGKDFKQSGKRRSSKCLARTQPPDKITLTIDFYNGGSRQWQGQLLPSEREILWQGRNGKSSWFKLQPALKLSSGVSLDVTNVSGTYLDPVSLIGLKVEENKSDGGRQGTLVNFSADTDTWFIQWDDKTDVDSSHPVPLLGTSQINLRTLPHQSFDKHHLFQDKECWQAIN